MLLDEHFGVLVAHLGVPKKKAISGLLKYEINRLELAVRILGHHPETRSVRRMVEAEVGAEARVEGLLRVAATLDP